MLAVLEVGVGAGELVEVVVEQVDLGVDLFGHFLNLLLC
jgi:16S rRNA A1518/A1519 N6-dimethyltransferase RsmA/KsgA/DIM1 with predicted DNA glycosylase/AP lyase activity